MSETKIKVAVRLRPSLPGESVIEDGFININEKGTSIEIRNSSFSFDCVFNPSVSNKDVYETLVSDKIKHLFEGFNCTILAYGSTGSGKTFTMGTASKVQEHNGLIPLGLKDIFKYADSIAHETDVVIKASFFEIYMENIKDLLKTESLFVPGDSKEAKITNMTEKTVKSFDEAMQALGKGVQARTTGATAKNTKSSRSHAFFILSLIMTNKNSGRSIFSKFQLVDLAGSERAGTDSTGKEFKQGIQINKGLTALGRVISSLSKKERHIPYRDSVLTRYLQDSFGGNSYTVMVTCISPALANVEETLSSLRYSHFAKKIKNTITVNRDSTDLIEHLKSELDRLRKIGICEEKEELMNKINYLNVCLDRASCNFEKIRERVAKLSVNIQSLEDKMISETFNQPLLNVHLEILRHIKEDLNSFMREHELFCCSSDTNISSSIEELSASSDMSPSDGIEQELKKPESIIKTLDDNYLEMEMKNLKVLYDFLQIKEEHRETANKLNCLVNKREQLSKIAFEPDIESNKLMDKIQSIDKEIQQCQQQAKVGALAIRKKNIDIFKRYEYLKQRFEELKGKQKVSFQEKLLQNDEDSSTRSVSLSKESQDSISNDLKCNKLEQKIIDLEKTIERLNSEEPYPIKSENIDSLDISEDILGHINHCLRSEVEVSMCCYEIRKIKCEVEKEFEDYEDPTVREILNNDKETETVINPVADDFQKRISICQHNLEIYKNKHCAKLELLCEDATRLLLDYLYTKHFTLWTKIFMLKSLEKSESSEDSKKIREAGFSEWESKLEDLWDKQDNKYEIKCKENEELKSKIEALEKENQQLRCACVKLPTLTVNGKGSKKNKSESFDSSMIEAYLSDDDTSFIQESERFDPDYRATPMWKRNRSKAKRKSPEDGAVLSSPKPSKNLSTSGCSCPSDCGTMRCSCKKKKRECSAFCECNKAKCMNTPSSNRQ